MATDRGRLIYPRTSSSSIILHYGYLSMVYTPNNYQHEHNGFVLTVSSCRIVRWQLEVVNGDSRNSIECLKCYDFGERDVVEDCSEGRHPKFGSRYRPIKTGIVQQKGGKFGEADNHGQ